MSTEREAFAKAIGALRPYLAELVVVGGWAHRLFRLRPRVTPPPFQPPVTDDVDVATPLNIGGNRQPIDTLLRLAGFEEDLKGDESPPVSRYVLKTGDQILELEFVAALQGGSQNRGGTRNATALVAGITAQKLRHVDVLLAAPWTVHLDGSVEYPVPGGPADVLIPNATSYLFQKLIVLSRRSTKCGKDMLYMFDTLRLFASSLDELKECWRVLSPTLRDNARREFAALRQTQFTAAADCVVAAAVMARETGRANPPSAATIAATCRAGFDTVFG